MVIQMKECNCLKKYNLLSIQAKATIWFTLCSILQKGISFFVVPIFTRLLTTKQYGTYSLYLSWLQIMTIITSLYLYYGVFNNGMNKFDHDRDRYISCMQGLTLTITAIVFLFYVFFHNAWEYFLGLSPILISFMFIEMSVTPAMSFWSGRQRFEYRYKNLVTVTLAKSMANPILGFIAVSLSDLQDLARIFSVVLVEVIFCGTIMVYQFIKGKCWFNRRYWRYALHMAIPLLPHYLSGMILNQGDRVMISKMVGTSEVAFYSVAYNIGMLVQIFTNALNNSFTPWAYERIKKENYKDIPQIINILLYLVSLISFCLMMMSPELVWIFGANGYASATYVIPPVAASVYFIYLYNILATPQFYFEKTQFLAFSSISAAIVNLWLNYVFIKLFGYIAAGYTTLICYVLYSLGHYIVSKRIMNEFIPGKRLYDYKMMFFLSIIIIFAVVISNVLFDFWYIRYGLLSVCIVVVHINRYKILSLFKNLKEKDL